MTDIENAFKKYEKEIIKIFEDKFKENDLHPSNILGEIKYDVNVYYGTFSFITIEYIVARYRPIFSLLGGRSAHTFINFYKEKFLRTDESCSLSTCYYNNYFKKIICQSGDKILEELPNAIQEKINRRKIENAEKDREKRVKDQQNEICGKRVLKFLGEEIK